MDSIVWTNWILVAIFFILVAIGATLEKLKNKFDNDNEYEDDDRTPLKEHLRDIKSYLNKLEKQHYMTDKEIKEERKWRIEKEELEMKEYEENEIGDYEEYKNSNKNEQ